MVALKGKSIDNFMARPNFEARAILIYGPDRGLTGERGKALVQHAAGTLDDPFGISKLSDQDLSGDPARLVDEAQTLSFAQTPRIVWIQPAETGFTAAMELLLSHPPIDAVIIAEAGDLKPTSKLRKIFEKQADLISLPCYSDDTGSLNKLIDNELSKFDLTITQEARMVLAGLLGADRGLSRSEIQKLCLYAVVKQEISLEDVEQICGDATTVALDKIVDAAGEGNSEQLDPLLAQALMSGVSSGQILLALGRHFTQLHMIRTRSDNAQDLDQVLSRQRPPIHFKRKRSIRHQCTIWRSEDLREALKLIGDMESKSRSGPLPIDASVARILLSLSSRANRNRRNL